MQHQSAGSNTCLGFAAQPEYQSHSMHLLGSTNLDQYQFPQPNNDVHYFNSQEPCLSPPIINTSEEGHGCGEIEHYENDCLEELTKSNCSQNQQHQEPEQSVHNQEVQRNKLNRKYIQGRLNNVDVVTIYEAKEVVLGYIGAGSDTAMVLFDPRATHSFISRKYVEDHKITMLPMRKPVVVNSPEGEKKANRICPKVSLDIKGVKFEANLIVLELMEIDVILGKGWLLACKGVINSAQRSVLLNTRSGERIEYVGVQPAPEEDKNDQLEDRYTEDSKVDHEFTEVRVEEQTTLEELNRSDDHV
jgi:hypothetical protein